MHVRIQYQIRQKSGGLMATRETAFTSAELALSAIALWNRQLNWVYSPWKISYEPNIDLAEHFPNTKGVS